MRSGAGSLVLPGLAKQQLLHGWRAHLALPGMAHVAWMFPPVGEVFVTLLA